jgi:hypothetical protein
MELSIGRPLAHDRLLEINREHQAKLEVELANLRELILDPFAGSAIRLRAAKDPDRKSIGRDLQERYCNSPRVGSARA